jgi:hypothetical protein
MRQFQEQNSDLLAVMQTHLIADMDTFGVWNDNYGTFLQMRAQRVSDELKSRIVAREIDHHGQALRDDDVEEEAISFE